MMNELARRAVRCKHWRWMPGMLATCDGRSPLRLAIEVMPYVWWGSDGTRQDGGHCLQSDVLPDLNDPATLGCLLALVREAWGCDWLTCQPLFPLVGVHGWRVMGTSAQSDHPEAAALVAALEAAP